MTTWLRAQAADIAGDRILRAYGVALALLHVVTFVHWYYQSDLPSMMGTGRPPMCWPFWESCIEARVLDDAQWKAILWGFLALSLVTAGAFLRERTARLGYFLLVAVSALRLAIVFQDYNLRLNQHYMASWATLVFLLLPNKRALIQHIVVAFYFFAGVLKLDGEWLSGAALYNAHKLWIPEPWLPEACAYVLVLECILVIGLYAKNPWIHYATMAQLAAFHVVSYALVGFYYPVLMACLLTIFPLVRAWSPPEQWPTPFDLVDKPEPWPGRVLILVFGAANLMHYAWPGDSAITGEGRLFALHMFDARVICEGGAEVHRDDGGSSYIPLTPREFNRSACDPIRYFNIGQDLCRKRAERPGWQEVDIFLSSRRSSDPRLKAVLDIHHFCGADLSYDLWRPNPWIKK